MIPFTHLGLSMSRIILSAKQFGILIKNNRKILQLTQKELAAVSGCGVRFIQDLEKGKQSCELGLSLRVMAMLGVRLEVKLPSQLEVSEHAVE